jgi:hypothetical protein
MLGGGWTRVLREKMRCQRKGWGKKRRKKVVSVSASVLAMGKSVMGMMGRVGSCSINVGVVTVGIAMSITGGIILMGRVGLRGSWQRSLRAVECRSVFAGRVGRRQETESQYRRSKAAKTARRLIISKGGGMASRIRGRLLVGVVEMRVIVNALQRAVFVRTVRGARHSTIDLFLILKSRIDHLTGQGFSVKDG